MLFAEDIDIYFRLRRSPFCRKLDQLTKIVQLDINVNCTVCEDKVWEIPELIYALKVSLPCDPWRVLFSPSVAAVIQATSR